ncbi:exosome complex protein Rrp42 [Methanomassiliicoccus luminyensis]|uniref:exosome complex protein Rrp42 n=1 Tax=Methanomassiliicoccus luminyensis TaxID=1080712 RepID=UPI000474BC3F|nr:exosome complex protein Rrp42 [Methanomassiliicoccus luminyensis]
MSEPVMSEIKKGHIHKLLSTGKRVDARAYDEYRPISIETNYIESAQGSARVRLGNTDILVGVKMEVGSPFPDTPDRGVLTTNTELIPLASPTFESGPPDAGAIELARVIDRGIRESEMIDLQKLCIKEGEEVWINFLDIYVLDYDGNLFDACFIGAVAALRSTIVPAKENEKGEDYPLPVRHFPIQTTAVKIENSILFDPTLDEEKVADARLSVTTDENGDLRAMQKGLAGAFTLDEVKQVIDTSLRVSKGIREIIG